MSYKKVWNFEEICFLCKAALLRNEEIICQKCIDQSQKYTNSELLRKHDAYDDVFCLFFYENNIKKVIYDIKVNLNTELLYPLGRLLANKIDIIDIDLITYIPSHFTKRLIKGFNSAKILAKEVASIKKIPVVSTLQRKNTLVIKEQKKMLGIERFDKINKEYNIKSKPSIKDKNILLIDDIMTSGATMNCCTNILKNHGAKKVYAGIIASGRNDIDF